MASTHLDLGEELGAIVAELGQPVERAAREMIVLELYRRSLISSGKVPSFRFANLPDRALAILQRQPKDPRSTGRLPRADS